MSSAAVSVEGSCRTFNACERIDKKQNVLEAAGFSEPGDPLTGDELAAISSSSSIETGSAIDIRDRRAGEHGHRSRPRSTSARRPA